MKRARLRHRPAREENERPQRQLIALPGSLYAASLDETHDERVLARTLPRNAILNK